MSDKVFLEQAKKGDETAFRCLFEKILAGPVSACV